MQHKAVIRRENLMIRSRPAATWTAVGDAGRRIIGSFRSITSAVPNPSGTRVIPLTGSRQPMSRPLRRVVHRWRIKPLAFRTPVVSRRRHRLFRIDRHQSPSPMARCAPP
jgi:hypothetical protein